MTGLFSLMLTTVISMFFLVTASTNPWFSALRSCRFYHWTELREQFAEIAELGFGDGTLDGAACRMRKHKHYLRTRKLGGQFHASKNVGIDNISGTGMSGIALAIFWAVMLLPISVLAGWEERTSMPTARSEMPAAYWDGSIYVPGGLGGMRHFESYDIKTDRWTELFPMPVNRHHLMTIALAGKIYIFGGADLDWKSTSDVWVYDSAGGVWKKLSSMPEDRYAGTAVLLNGFVYIAGGAGPSGRLLRYDPKQDNWVQLASTQLRRDHSSAVVFDGRIVVIGGRFPATAELNSIEIYDPENDKWNTGPSLNVARAGHAAVVHRGKIIVMGGEVILNGRNTLADSEVLDSLAAKWRFGTRMPKPFHGMPVVSDGAHLYLIGGSQQAATAENHGRVYRRTE